ncbi:MAG TPA: response regulator [Bryobacteraceae bacterium]|nr:response regulator [Bryobacteraceae bacterium]
MLVLTGEARDASAVGAILLSAKLLFEVCESAVDLLSEIDGGAGVVIISAGILDSEFAELLAARLKLLPSWSDLPLLVLGAPQGSFGPLSDTANLTFLDWPAGSAMIASLVRASLRSRSTQYQLRDCRAELERIEENLRRMQKLESIGLLAGGVAHDFNNLLVGILGNSSLAMDMLPELSPARVLLQDVLVAGQRAGSLTRQLLTHHSGKSRFSIALLDLSGLVREISGLIQPSIPKLVRLRLDLDPDLPAVQGDASQLQQLVMNLVINGAEAVVSGMGSVSVTTRLSDLREENLPRSIPPTSIQPGRYICLEVRDDGAGMDTATLARIFDPFYTTKLAGRGLGLAAALGIVRSHAGGIEVETAPGKGSTFRVYLPAAGAAQLRKVDSASREVLSGGGEILIVDDEEVVRNFARNCLQQFGYTSVVAANGQDALEIFRRDPSRIAAVLLDLSMPVMSGEETLRELRRIRPDVKILLSTGYDEAETAIRFEDSAVSAFVQKPYTAGELARKVKAALQSSATMQG